jgi:hypothetical protein
VATGRNPLGIQVRIPRRREDSMGIRHQRLHLAVGVLLVTLVGCADGASPDSATGPSDASPATDSSNGQDTAVSRLELGCLAPVTNYRPNIYVRNVGKLDIVPAGPRALVWSSGFYADFPGPEGDEERPPAQVSHCIDVADFDAGTVTSISLPDEYADAEVGFAMEAVSLDPVTGVVHVAGRVFGNTFYNTRSVRDTTTATPLVHLEYDLRSQQWAPSPLTPSADPNDVFYAHIRGSATHAGGIIVQKSQYGREPGGDPPMWATDNVIIRFDVIDGVSTEVARLPIPVTIMESTRFDVSDDLSRALITTEVPISLDEKAHSAVLVDFDEGTVTTIPLTTPGGLFRLAAASQDFSALHMWATPNTTIAAQEEFGRWADSQFNAGTVSHDAFLEKASTVTRAETLLTYNANTGQIEWEQELPILTVGFAGFDGQIITRASHGGVWVMADRDIPPTNTDEFFATEEARRVLGYSDRGELILQGMLCDRLNGGSLTTSPDFPDAPFPSETDIPLGVFDIGRTDQVMVACQPHTWEADGYRAQSIYLAIRDVG